MSKLSGDLPEVVAAGVDRTLQLAQTWLVWDEKPRISDGGDRIYTPVKALRRYADHLVDHLAQIEALVAGEPSLPDQWHASPVTFPSDWARFTEVDLDEATQRLQRLAEIYRIRLASLGADAWDLPRGDAWTIREIVNHVASPWYAEQVGDLSSP